VLGVLKLKNSECRIQNKDMNNDLKPRTKKFALEVVKFWESLPKDETSKTLGRQLLRAGTSVGTN
jgi:hypothetical protein